MTDVGANENPYRPPIETADAPPATGAVGGRTVALYSPGQVVLATFLGTPIAGSIILALNERWLTRAGRPGNPTQTVVLGILATAVVFGIAMILPEDLPAVVFNLPVLIAMHYVASGLQGELFTEHMAQGGERGSSWVVAGIGLSFTIALVLLLALFA